MYIYIYIYIVTPDLTEQEDLPDAKKLAAMTSRPELPLARLFIHLMLSDRFRLDGLGRFVQVGEVKEWSLGLPLLSG